VYKKCPFPKMGAFCLFWGDLLAPGSLFRGKTPPGKVDKSLALKKGPWKVLGLGGDFWALTSQPGNFKEPDLLGPYLKRVACLWPFWKRA